MKQVDTTSFLIDISLALDNPHMEELMKTGNDVTGIPDWQVSAALFKVAGVIRINNLVANRIGFSAVCYWTIKMIA
jgi:hypothetical protein